MEFKSEIVYGVTVEVNKTAKGAYTYSIKLTDTDDKNVVKRIENIVAELNKKFPQE